MSIDPWSYYNHLTLHRNHSILWTINGPLSGNLIAGLSMGIFTMVDFMSINSPIPYKPSEMIEIGTYQNQTNIYHSPKSDSSRILIDLSSKIPSSTIENPLGNYIIATDADPSDYLKYNPDDNHFAWWITNYSESYRQIDRQTGKLTANNRYTVCRFSNQDFIRGFITICDSYNIDFRNVSLGKPFTYDTTTRKRIYHDIPGYDTTHFTLTPRIPAPIGPYYIEDYENDPFGGDFN